MRSFFSLTTLCLLVAVRSASAAPADLTLTNADIVFSTNTPEPVQVITISATIRNDGDPYGNNTPTTSHDYLVGVSSPGVGVYYSRWYAQSFSPDRDQYLGKVSLLLWNAGATDDSIKVEIRAHDSAAGAPDTTVLVSKTLVSTYTAAADWQDFVFDTSPLLMNGATYWICAENTVTNANDAYAWKLDSGTPVGQVLWSNNRGGDWTVPTAKYTAFYRVYQCTNTLVSCYRGDPDAGGILIGQRIIPVPVVNSVPRTVSWEWPAVAGSNDIYVAVDYPSPGIIAETLENNNKAVKSIDVAATIPQVTTSYPPEDETSVGINETVRLSFGEDMDAAKTKGALSVAVVLDWSGNTVNTPVTGTVDYSNRILTFTAAWKKGCTYRVTLSTDAQDLYGNGIAAEKTWTFSTVPLPSIMGQVFPLENALNVCPTEQIKVTFSDNMDPALAGQAVTVKAIRDQNGTTIDTLITGTTTYASRLLTFAAAWTKGYTYQVTVSTDARDPYGNPLPAGKTWNFSILPPLAIAGPVAPAEDATGVGVTDPVSITFNDTMDPERTGEALTVKAIQDAAGATIDELVAGTTNYAGKTLTFTATWKKGCTYRVTLSTDARDLYGNGIPALKTWTFSTVSLPSIMGQVFPLENALNVCPTEQIKVTFSDDLDPTLARQAITVKAVRDESGNTIDTLVSGTTTYAARLLTFAATWAKGYTYQVTVSTDAKDPYGNPLSAGKTWSFTATASLAVGQVSPSENATGVGAADPVTITFNDAMDAASTKRALSVRAIRDAAGTTIDELVTGTTDYGGKMLTFSTVWKKGYTYRVTISTDALDLFGNGIPDAKTWTFTVLPPPAIAGTVSPAEDSREVTPADTVRITFVSDDMDPALTQQALSVRAIRDNDGNNIDTAVSGATGYSGKTLTFTASWQKGYTYRVTLSTGAQDLYGNAIPAAKTWVFTVLEPPAVAAISPAENSHDVTPEDTVRVTFLSGDMDPAFTQQALSVKAIRDNDGNAIDTPVSGTIGYVNRTLTFDAPWQKGYTYRVTLSTGARDLYGNAIGSGRSWIFTTAMDHGIENTVIDNATRTRVVCEPNLIDGDYYLAIDTNPASLSACAARITRANEKLKKVRGAFASPIGGTYRKFTLYRADGTEFTGIFTGARIVMPYAEETPGVVRDASGLLVREKTLALYRLDEANELWLKVPGAEIDDSNNTVSTRVGHFSIYALLGSNDTDLSAAYAYPVPWKPFSGRPEAGTLAGGITFTGLGSEATIRIYTLSGELVRALRFQYSGGSEQAVWDGTNSSHEPVASGVYLYYIENSKEHTSGKLIIVK